MDEFAQTRQPDDLFDDDFTPITETTPEIVNSDHAISGQEAHAGPQKPQNPHTNRDESQQSGKDDITDTPQRPGTKAEVKPPQAVRGDRSATGGVLKPKLTEDELSARLAAAKLNNAKREEAHRLAEADEAEFQQREADEIQKRKQEGISRREMDRERERNRQRKLAVKSGREWDESKEEQEPLSRSGGYFRGAHGSYRGSKGRGGYEDTPRTDQGTSYINEQDDGRGRGRGRGGRRGLRSDRGREGRGGPANTVHGSTKPPTASDFPELPKVATALALEKPKISAAEADNLMKAPTGGQQSWADQVEAGR